MVGMINQIARIGLGDVLESISAPVFLVDGAGSVVYANEPLARLTGADLREIMGQPYTALVSRFDQMNGADLLSKVKALLANLDRAEHINVSLHRPGPRHLRIEIFPVLARAPDISWGCMICEHERYARQHQALLAFVHELRSALVSLVGHITLLNGSDYVWGDEQRQDFLGMMNDQVQGLIWLLEIVRDAAQIEANTLRLDRQPADLKPMILRVARGVSDELPTLDLLLEVPENLPPVSVDAVRLGRAFQLLLNSVLAQAGDHQVRVIARQDGDQIRVSLSYQGGALAEGFEQRQYADLFQARSFVANSPHNLELGVYVAKSVLQAHGGCLTVDHHNEAGIALHLTIPCARGTGAGCEEVAAPLLVTQPARPNAKILLVEDDRQLSRFLKTQLELIGYQTIVTDEGHMALELAAVEMPDLILLDLSLPDSSGLDVCRDLREFTSVPVIMITGNSNEEDMVRSLNIGADDYILKPLRPKVLVARIQANLRRSYLSNTSEKGHGREAAFTLGDLEVNFAQRQISRLGQPMTLTPVEHKLIYHLAANAGRILTHDQLISKVWGPMFRQETQYLWVNISRLRAKIEDDPHNPKYILTERGVGYYMPCPGDFDAARRRDEEGHPGAQISAGDSPSNVWLTR
jgi:DNA-binding response OmpR family regulator/signal transduction histidine kinase